VQSTEALPAAFLGHGNPMNAIEHNRYTDAWRRFGAVAPTPRAVLAISAHWFTNITAVTAMAQPRTIHDFYGFPAELFAVEYSAPGAPDIAEEVSEIVKPEWVGLDQDSWGLDHGTWSVLRHVYPNADVPVIQLSINAQKSFDYHLGLGARLAPLRQRGVLIIGSGNVVHNLQRIDWTHPDGGFDWAHRFDDAARELLTTAPGNILMLQGHPDFSKAVPTPDHFLPLVYLAALADVAHHSADVLIDGYAMGSLSMTAYTVEVQCPGASADAGAAPSLSGPDTVPPDESNV
jgi:4,5-DOPA dioxygenase extradiol